MSPDPTTGPVTGPGSTRDPFPDAVLVPRPDRDAYRVRWVANGALGMGGVGLAVLALLTDADGSTRLGMLLGGLLAVLFAGWATWWQRRTWLDPEPALVLAPTRFRVLHKDEHLWVPWTDVADLEVAGTGAGLWQSRVLLFRLRPGATTDLPRRRAGLSERSFASHTGDLAYSRPYDSPRLPEVVRVAAGLWASANGIDLDVPDARP